MTFYCSTISGRPVHFGDLSPVSSDSEDETVKNEPMKDSLSISIDQEDFSGLSHSFHYVLVSTNVNCLIITCSDATNYSCL